MIDPAIAQHLFAEFVESQQVGGSIRGIVERMRAGPQCDDRHAAAKGIHDPKQHPRADDKEQESRPVERMAEKARPHRGAHGRQDRRPSPAITRRQHECYVGSNVRSAVQQRRKRQARHQGGSLERQRSGVASRGGNAALERTHSFDHYIVVLIHTQVRQVQVLVGREKIRTDHYLRDCRFRRRLQNRPGRL